MSWDDLSKNEMVWPSVRDVLAYRRQAYAAIRAHILTHPCLDSLPVTWVRRRRRRSCFCVALFPGCH